MKKIQLIVLLAGLCGANLIFAAAGPDSIQISTQLQNFTGERISLMRVLKNLSPARRGLGALGGIVGLSGRGYRDKILLVNGKLSIEYLAETSEIVVHRIEGQMVARHMRGGAAQYGMEFEYTDDYIVYRMQGSSPLTLIVTNLDQPSGIQFMNEQGDILPVVPQTPEPSPVIAGPSTPPAFAEVPEEGAPPSYDQVPAQREAPPSYEPPATTEAPPSYRPRVPRSTRAAAQRELRKKQEARSLAVARRLQEEEDRLQAQQEADARFAAQLQAQQNALPSAQSGASQQVLPLPVSGGAHEENDPSELSFAERMRMFQQ